MSIPVMPAEPAGLQLARQQLDELDALLERMLALPVYQAEDGPVDQECGAQVFSEDASGENDGASSMTAKSWEPQPSDCAPVQSALADPSAAAEILMPDIAVSTAAAPFEPSRLDDFPASPST